MVQNSEYYFFAIRYIKLYSEIISSMRPTQREGSGASYPQNRVLELDPGYRPWAGRLVAGALKVTAIGLKKKIEPGTYLVIDATNRVTLFSIVDLAMLLLQCM